MQTHFAGNTAAIAFFRILSIMPLVGLAITPAGRAQDFAGQGPLIDFQMAPQASEFKQTNRFATEDPREAAAQEIKVSQYVWLTKSPSYVVNPSPCNVDQNPGTYMYVTAKWLNTSDYLLREIRTQTMVQPGVNTLEEVDYSLTADQIVAPREYFTIIYRIKMNSCRSFPFYVDLFGKIEMSQRAFDVHVSLYRNPLALAPGDKAKYTSIINAFGDTVYEASNGAHRIRSVTFHHKEFQRQADVNWVETCAVDNGPSAPPSGRKRPGKSIHFCDSWSPGWFKTWANWVAADSPLERGYTLGHEWGHFFYGMLDEYKKALGGGARPANTDTPVSPSVMNDQYGAITLGRSWLNFSSQKIYDKLGAVSTAQQRIYAAPAWPTLVRNPSADPAVTVGWWLPRYYYPELAGFRPDADDATAAELAQGYRIEPRLPAVPPVPDPQVYWAGRRYVVMIAIDRSQVMLNQDRLAKAKASAKLLVDQLELGAWKVGIMSFDGSVSVVKGITEMDTEAARTTIKTAIDTIAAGDARRAIANAAQQALQLLLSADSSNQANRFTFLIAGGPETEGGSPLSKGLDYRDNRAKLAVAEFGTASPDRELRSLALDVSRQNLYWSPAFTSDLLHVLDGMVTDFGPVTQVGYKDPTDVPVETFRTDESLTGLNVVASYWAPQGVLNFKLRGPDGSPYAPACTTTGSEVVCLFQISFPAKTDAGFPKYIGLWQLEVQTSLAKYEWSFAAFGVDDSVNTYLTNIHSATNRVVSYPERLIISADLSQDMPIAKAAVNAQVKRPDGSIATLSLHDDGVAPDGLADDGTYTGLLNYSADGAYLVQVGFNNSLGTAQLTSRALLGEDTPVTIPISGQFTSVAQTQLFVEGVKADDYGNSVVAATLLPADWTGLPGRLELLADFDVFRIEPRSTGTLDFVLRDLGGGINPRLRILGSDGSTVLVNATMATHGTPDGRLKVTIPATNGKVIYAEVSDVGGASGGFYRIVCGISLP